MEKPITCIILDDEPFAVQLLQDYAAKISALKVIYAGEDAYKVVDLLNSRSIDLIFIDLQMPELTGMEVMQMFKDHHNFIITSAYRGYALDAFKFNVIDFLLKPITFQTFHQSVQKYLQWRQRFVKPAAADHFFVKADRKQYRIDFTSICYIEGLKDYLRIHTEENKIVMHGNMKDILEKLPRDQFIRIHRSYIIPLNHIKVIEGSRIQLKNEIQLPIGETYKKPLLEWVRTE